MPQAVLKFHAAPPQRRGWHTPWHIVCHDWPVGGRIIRVTYHDGGWVTEAHFTFDVLCETDGTTLNRCETEKQRTFVVAWDHTPVPDNCEYLLSCYDENNTALHLFAVRDNDDRQTKSD